MAPQMGMQVEEKKRAKGVKSKWMQKFVRGVAGAGGGEEAYPHGGKRKKKFAKIGKQAMTKGEGVKKRSFQGNRRKSVTNNTTEVVGSELRTQPTSSGIRDRRGGNSSN